MRDRSILFQLVVWASLGGLTAGLVWLFALIELPSLLLLPAIGGLGLCGFLLLGWMPRHSRSSRKTGVLPASEAPRSADAIASTPHSSPSLHLSQGLRQDSPQDSPRDSPQASPQASSLGHFKDHYRLLEMLASGKFGKTYVAEDLTARPKSLWVIKHFIPQPDADRDLQTTRRLFKGEASVLEKLKTLECVPKLLSYFEDEQEIWFIREYIVGHPLDKEIVEGRPLSELQIIELLTGILRGLDAIHQFQIIHRDIKPSNIIRRKKDSHLILIDFGAAKEWNPEEDSKPMMTVAVGTASYTSYEQMMGQPVPSSDIYSAGVIAIQAITGLVPSRLPLSITGEYSWRDYAKVSPKLAGILEKMTRTTINRRYQTAAAVLADLESL